MDTNRHESYEGRGLQAASAWLVLSASKRAKARAPGFLIRVHSCPFVVNL